MKCDECQELVFEYADNTLPADTRLEINKHIAECPSCKALLSQEKALLANTPNALAASMAALRIDPAMRQNIIIAAESETIKAIQTNSRTLWLAAAAAILITSIVMLNLRTPGSAGHRPTSSIQTIATVYSDSSKTYWTKRTLIIQRKNGSESFLKIVATRPQVIQVTKLSQGDGR